MFGDDKTNIVVNRKIITVDPSQILTDFNGAVSTLNVKGELIAFDNQTITTGFFVVRTRTLMLSMHII